MMLLLMVSCSGNNRTVFPDPVQTTTLKKNFEGVYLKYPYRVRIIDTLLYVTDLHGDKYFCHEFDYPALKYRKSFAAKGKAPNEFLSVGNIGAGNDGKLSLLDVFARKVYKWEDERITLQTTFPHEMGMVLDFALYNDSAFIVPDFTGEKRINIVDCDGKTIRGIGTIPTSSKIGVHQVVVAKAWRSFIHYNPQNDIVALATQLGEVLEVYNLQSGETHITIGADGEPKCVFSETNARPDGVMGYGDVFVGNRNIYAIYWGHRIEEMKQGKITEEGGKFFRIFDLDGNPLRQFVLDCHITGFSVDEETQTIVASDPNNEQLVKFGFQP